MATSRPSPARARFDRFQVDLSTGDLRTSAGYSTRIQQKPLQVLRLLLEAGGQAVTREQLRVALWPEETFVDFEHGVNTAVRKLRQALEDSGENPKFIETLPKVGYRFLFPVEWGGDRVPVGSPPLPAIVPRAASAAWGRKKATVAIATVMVLGASVLAYFGFRAPSVPKVANYLQLTHDGQPKWLVGTDGTRIYLGLGSLTLQSIGEVSVAGGEPRKMSTPPATHMIPLALSPDGLELLAVDGQGAPYHGRFWSLPVVSGAPRRLADTEGRSASWSHDGKALAYSSGRDLFLAKADGTEPRKLATLKVPTDIDEIVWSPDGSNLRFQAAERPYGPAVLWEASTKNSDVHRLLPGESGPPNWECCGKWTPDGRYFVFSSHHQIWALPKKGTLLNSHPKPIQLTASPMPLSTPLPSTDGKKLFVVGYTRRGQLTRYEPKSGQLLPFLGGISAEYVDFSRDGQWVTYVSYPDGTLWRSKVDGSERLQLTHPPDYPLMPRWSPDGKRIVFFVVPADKSARIYEVSPEGGSPRQLMPDDPNQQGDPNWSPDGTKIVLGVAGGGDPASTIRVLDLTTRQVSTLAGSQGFYSPRWSPDGRYIAAMTFDSSSLLLFDFQTGKWTQIAEGSVGAFPNWSKDAQYIYGFGPNATGTVLRIRISDHTVEPVADLKTFTSAGRYDRWLALAPDDSILLLRNTGTEDVYALDWEAP